MCGNGLPDPGEQCDNGGTCYATSKAGQACTSDVDCVGQAGDAAKGVCESGTKLLWACSADTDCPGSRCVKCKTVGGDDCAANCTTESNLVFKLKTPDSKSLVYGALDVTIALNGQETLRGGKKGADGTVPFVVKQPSVSIVPNGVTVLGAACACVRAVALKTCGGTLFNKDGTSAVSCTAGFADPPSNCNGLSPCAFVHGPDNSGTGVVGCDGLTGFNSTYTQTRVSTTNAGVPQISLSGVGPAGSAAILNSTALGQTSGACKPTNACPAVDPTPANMGSPSTVPQVTGTATGTFNNNNNNKTLNKSVTGAAFKCTLDGSVDPSAPGTVVSASTSSSSAILKDSVITAQYFFTK